MINENLRSVILETSDRVGQVALGVGTSIIAERHLDETRRHARDLVPAPQKLLNEQNWRAREVAGVVVSHGPGSYTGLRVGIMSAKTFAYVTGATLLAVATFEAVAARALPEVNDLEVIADAQQDKIYVQRFCRVAGDPNLSATTPITVLPLRDWLEQRDPTCWVSGAGLRLSRVQEVVGLRALDESQWNPSPASLLACAYLRMLQGQGDDLWQLEPHYARPSSAEEKWDSLGR